jgi:hypothetical protein
MPFTVFITGLNGGLLGEKYNFFIASLTLSDAGATLHFTQAKFGSVDPPTAGPPPRCVILFLGKLLLSDRRVAIL